MDTVFDENGNEWFPLYTDMDEIEGHVPSCITMNVPIRTILENALNSDRVMGVAVNPFTDQMLLAKKIVGVILDEWEGDKKEE